jgi:rhodanese-related sulfurtransferase
MKKHIPALVSFAFFLLCMGCTSQAGFGETVSYETLQKWMGDTAILTIPVDIRQDEEAAPGMIPGARHIPLADLEERIYELPRDARIVLYCQSGRRVQSALPIFKKMDYKNVYDFVSVTNWQGDLEYPEK